MIIKLSFAYGPGLDDSILSESKNKWKAEKLYIYKLIKVSM